jgi:protein gp37
MGAKTSIEWTNATWNPVTGCTKVSAGCKHCYAERVFPRVYGKERKFTDVVCHEDRLQQPLHWKKPRRIFVNSMSDLFHEDVPNDFLNRLFSNVMEMAERHTFQILTKRAGRMKEYLSWRWGEGRIPMRNIWIGVSVEDQKTADERIPLLLQTPAAVRFISYEPALAPINLAAVPAPGCYLDGFPDGLHWVIAGSESGPQARDYDTEWFANVARQCEQANVPFFMKQLTMKGRTIPFEQWPGYLQIREYP